MRFHVLASDYDGTLAHHGRVDAETVAALRRLHASGRQLVLVTGRELSELLMIFPEVHLFARVVAENGALLYRPATEEQKLLCPPPPEKLLDALKRRGVTPAVGRSIVATWRPHETAVLDAIRELGLDWQVIFNKDAVMALPGGVTKATGFLAALRELGMTPHEAVGVGDAENDHALLQLCECGVAVANAIEPLKERADLATQGDHGVGVRELIGLLLENDLRSIAPRITRHDLVLGQTSAQQDIRLPGFDANLLLVGSVEDTASIATRIFEQLVERRYQCCLLDATARFKHLKHCVTQGDALRAPVVEDAQNALDRAEDSVVIDLQGHSAHERASFCRSLLAWTKNRREQVGRPHWIFVEDADSLLDPIHLTAATAAKRVILMTHNVRRWTREALAGIDVAIFLGASAEHDCRGFCETVGADASLPTGQGDCLFWERRRGRPERGWLRSDPVLASSTSNLPS